ncbi:hypothetical protein V8E54_008072 [Elaphomyces granulatus]
MDITNEAAQFLKTANGNAHYHGTPQLDNSARHVAGQYYRGSLGSNRHDIINPGGFRRKRQQSNSSSSAPPPTLTPTCRLDPLNIMAIDEGAVRANFRLKYRVPGTEEHIFEFLSPPTCVYADSLRFTTIACITINLHSPIANASVVVIHITTSPTVLHDSPRET